MPRAGNQIELSPKLYFFNSPVANTTKCLIWAHSGLLHGDGTYPLAAGLRMRYYVRPGDVREVSPAAGIQAGNAAIHARYTDAGPMAIPNYTLTKALGSGLNEAFSYHDVQRNMNTNAGAVGAERARRGGQPAIDEWCPHVVSVRRRFRCLGKTVQLGEVIDAVLAHNDAITDFYLGGCRGDLSRRPVRSFLTRAAIEVFG
jgi:hypothetical protein